MDTKKIESTIRTVFSDVYCNSNKERMLEKIKEHFAENIQLHDPAVPKFKGGLEEYRKLEAMYLQAFPDRRLVIDDVVCTDNCAVVRWTCTATHQGQYSGVAPSKKKITISGISEYTLSPNGKISAIHQSWDRLALLEQIGALESVAAHR